MFSITVEENEHPQFYTPSFRPHVSQRMESVLSHAFFVEGSLFRRIPLYHFYFQGLFYLTFYPEIFPRQYVCYEKIGKVLFCTAPSSVANSPSLLYPYSSTRASSSSGSAQDHQATSSQRNFSSTAAMESKGKTSSEPFCNPSQVYVYQFPRSELVFCHVVTYLPEASAYISASNRRFPARPGKQQPVGDEDRSGTAESFPCSRGRPKPRDFMDRLCGCALPRNLALGASTW